MARWSPIIVWRWWITDERTGKRRLTRWHMTEADALARFADAERAPDTREERGQATGAAAVVTRGLP